MKFAPTAVYRNHQPDPTPRLPAIDDEHAWRELLNHLFVTEKDEIFRWAKRVRAAVCHPEPENPVRQGIAA